MRELVADIPPDEWKAAVEAEDWDMDTQGVEEGDESGHSSEEEGEEDPSYSHKSESSEDEEESEDGSCSEHEGPGDVMEDDVDSADSDISAEFSAGIPTPPGTPHTD